MATRTDPHDEPRLPILTPPSEAPARATPHPAPLARNTVRDTWGWLWKDTLGRVVPLTAGALLYGHFSGNGRHALGLTGRRWRRDVALGVAAGIPMAGIAAIFRAWVAPHHRLPTPADQAFQTAFYFGLNAPAEELFWRGTVQTLAERGVARLPHMKRAAPWLGWSFATATFGLYHRLGNWSWRAVAGVTAAGGLFGALYRLQRRPRSLLAPIIVHACATAGFLSWGDVYLHLRARRHARRPSDASS